MRRCSRCWPAARRVTQPESTSHDAGKADTGESAHFRALERLYLSAPINQFFPSRLIIDEAGHSRIAFSLDENFYHAARSEERRVGKEGVSKGRSRWAPD